MPTQVDALKGTRRYSHTLTSGLTPIPSALIWMLPRTSSCAAMENLLQEPQNALWHDYDVVNVSAPGVGVDGCVASCNDAIASGFETKTITPTVGKLTTGVTVPQWSSILMLRNLQAPETYFQAAFRVQSPWTIRKSRR